MHRRALIVLTLALPPVLAGQSPPAPDLPNAVMFEFIRSSVLPQRARVAIELPASALSPYVGVYELALGLELDVTLQNGALHIRSSIGSAAVQLWPASNNDFFAKDVDAQVTFVRDASGAVSGLVLHQYGRDRPAKKRR